MFRKSIDSRWFPLFAFLVLIGSSISLYLQPEMWLPALLLPAVCWGVLLVTRGSLQKQLGTNWLLVIFVLTGMVGYWAAYDQRAAWGKLCLLLAAVLFYLIIVEQPRENLEVIAGFWFVAGVGVAAYFLSTFDFNSQPEKLRLLHRLGMFWTQVRPIELSLPSIHPNDAAGISIITASYGLYFLQEGRYHKRGRNLVRLATLVGIGIVGWAVLLSSSRGALLALVGAIGIWVLWRLLVTWQSSFQAKLIAFFPKGIAIGLLGLVLLPLAVSFEISRTLFFAGGNVTMSRLELFRSGIWILKDFPFTGGGLDSFPGLFSQYVVVIPYYSILNSHNMFLDVTIEQGILGGFSFLLIYLVAAWRLLSAWRHGYSSSMRALCLASGLSLFTALLHGLVDDYIYGGRGTLLALVPVAMAALVAQAVNRESEPTAVSTITAREPQRFLTTSSLWAALVIMPAMLLAFFWRGLVAQWYANIGSVKMAKVDLAAYPANRWYDGGENEQWTSAERDFRRALGYEPGNRTANYRLGLLTLLDRDFSSASGFLQKAYDKDSTNRGVIKNLGYTYVWLGNTDAAQPFLTRIPEARDELGVYVWWWGVQNRKDLAKRASVMVSQLQALSSPQQ